MVRRQPFGGWKASSVGPGAKAGGPNYVLQLARWHQLALPAADTPPAPAVEELLERCLEATAGVDERALLRAAASSYARAWRAHFARDHDPSGVLGEQNVFRYRPCRRVLVRGDPEEPGDRLALCQVLLAAATCGTPLTISMPRPAPWHWLPHQPDVTVVRESMSELIERLQAGCGAERMRVWGSVPLQVRVAANHAWITLIDAPVLVTGRLELRWYLREQTISRELHRYGSVIEPAATE